MFSRYLSGSSIQSAIYPEDLTLLQRVFDQICADGNHALASVEGEAIAATLMMLFERGIKDEVNLLAEMRLRQADFMKDAG